MLNYALQGSETRILHAAFDGVIVSPEQWIVTAYVADIQLKPNGLTRKNINFV